MSFLQKKISLLASSGWIVFLFLSCLIFFRPSFDTNDDAVMNYIAAGAFDGHPSEFTLFTNFLVGLLLKNLFLLRNDVNWYTLFFFLAQLLSLLQINAVLLKRNSSVAGFLIFCMILVIVACNFLIKLQFTSTAFIAAAAGVISLFFYFEKDQRDRNIFMKSIFFFTLSGLIRWDSFIAVLVIACIPLGSLIWQRRKEFYLHLFYLLMLIPLLLPVVNNYYYEKINGSDYLKFQHAAHNLLDYNNSITDSLLRAHDLSENDYSLFKTYFRSDEQVYGPEKILSLEKAATRNPRVSLAAHVMYDYARSFAFFFVAVIISAWMICIVPKQKKILTFSIFLFVFLFLLVLGTWFKLPIRVYGPAWFVYIIIIFYAGISFMDIRQRMQKLIYLTGISILFAIAFIQLGINRNISKANALLQKNNVKNVAVINEHAGTIFIAVDCSLHFHQPFLFRQPPGFKHHNFIDGATFTNSPVYDKLLQKNDLDNLTSDLMGREVVFISGDSLFFDYYKKFLTEHYSLHIVFEEYPALPDAKKVIWMDEAE
ncbi:MAG: hypothetical protein H7X71_04580 [Chitinophagales bacterium]|nr:hypothetical protein [Chitinophagales bacterium]